MSPSALLDSFDPLATHPFTNNSGLMPQPSQPSRYPIPVPSPPRTRPYYYAGPSSYPDSETSSSPSSVQTPLYLSPQPRRGAPGSPPHIPASPTQPIFVPFRRETSSPDLVLKKKSPSQGNSFFASRPTKS